MRSRLWVRDSTVAGQGQTIAIAKVLPYNAEWLQWSIKFSAVPVTSENLVFTKVSVAGAQYNVEVLNVNPSTWGYAQKLCTLVCGVQFAKGDTITVTYANTDNVTIGLELVFREGY